MAKIRHIALTTENPEKVAAFYKEAFEMEEVRRSDNGAVFLSDGYINPGYVAAPELETFGQGKMPTSAPSW